MEKGRSDLGQPSEEIGSIGDSNKDRQRKLASHGNTPVRQRCRVLTDCFLSLYVQAISALPREELAGRKLTMGHRLGLRTHFRWFAPYWLPLATACLSGCSQHASDPKAPSRAAVVETVVANADTTFGMHFRFVDVAEQLGLSRVLWCGRPGKDHLLDSAGTGAAFLDYDRDGRLDIYVVNGWRLEGEEILERGKNALYHGLPGGSFEDVTVEAGVDGGGNWGAGIFAADYNADGWPDLLVTNFGPIVLYRNRGDGTFENVAPQLGIEAPGWNTGASFFDANRDGKLDLYVAAYIDCSLDDVLNARRTLDWKGLEKVAFGPFGLQGAQDHFFLATDDGRYIDATTEAGFVDKALGFGFATRAGDYDRDGDIDLYVANDSDANYLYQNEGDGTFREVGLWTGCALSGMGAAQASMGIAVGDATGDGIADLFVSHFSEDHSTFYRGTEADCFEDATNVVGLNEPTVAPMSWGSALVDLDNDGDLDLVVANGHIYPQVDRHTEAGQSYAQRNQLFENRGGTFVEVSEDAGPGFQLIQSSRGLAVGDYDNDGDLDLLFTSLDAPPALLRNDSRCGSWLTVECKVPPGQGSVVGVRVVVTVDDRTQEREIAVGDSYMSTHDERLHFGLGDVETVDQVLVVWPDGSRTVRKNVKARQFLVIRK